MTNKNLSNFITALNKISGKGFHYLRSIEPSSICWGVSLCLGVTAVTLSGLAASNRYKANLTVLKNLEEIKGTQKTFLDELKTNKEEIKTNKREVKEQIERLQKNIYSWMTSNGIQLNREVTALGEQVEKLQKNVYDWQLSEVIQDNKHFVQIMDKITENDEFLQMWLYQNLNIILNQVNRFGLVLNDFSDEMDENTDTLLQLADDLQKVEKTVEGLTKKSK